MSPMQRYSDAIAPLALSYVLYLAVYRLLFHPLKSFPGPRLAALTGWYQTYYEVFCDGLFVQKLEELHKIYGTSPQASTSVYLLMQLRTSRSHKSKRGKFLTNAILST